MHIAFRVDSSTIIGHGHVMRCLTLAQALVRAKKQFEINVSFITKANQGNINHLISKADYQLVLIATGDKSVKQEDSDTWLGCLPEQDAKQTIAAIKTLPPIDLLIVDHYAITKTWHQLVKPYCQKLMVIDDLANRALDCDILLDQTLNRHAIQYQQLVPEHCQLLLGQNYMLLRDEFEMLKTQANTRRQQRSTQLTQANILITMGGGDPDNLSELALLAIEKLRADLPNISATLVLSSQSKHIKSLQQRQQKLSWCTLITDSQNMAQLMLNADIAIGASGATAWERCCLGLPTLTTVNAKNQQLIAKNLAETGASLNLGWYQKITIEAITKQLKVLLNNPQKYLIMAEKCFSACDGQGATRVAKVVIQRYQTYEQ
jgi:UDP-2,4-diacetamido-2,4,6-trideoxy-beta-L-altropyranose hydrolase